VLWDNFNRSASRTSKFVAERSGDRLVAERSFYMAGLKQIQNVKQNAAMPSMAINFPLKMRVSAMAPVSAT